METRPSDEKGKWPPALYDLEVKPLSDDPQAPYGSLEWYKKYPDLKVVRFGDTAGQPHTYEYYLAEDNPRYEPIPDLLDNFPQHIIPMLDTKMDRKVIAKAAIKKVLNDPDEQLWMQTNVGQEAHFAGVTEHPNIASIYGLAADRGKTLFIIMEYLPNGTLDKWLVDDHKENEIGQLVEDVSSALEHIHTTRRLVYCDMKPYNVGFDASGRAKLLDFEHAVKMKKDGRADPPGGGSRFYESPEQKKGYGTPLTVESDIYSLAATIFSVLIEADTDFWDLEKIRDNFVKDEKASVPFRSAYQKKLSPRQKKEVSRVLRKALAEDPASRYHSAAEFNRDFQSALSWK